MAQRAKASPVVQSRSSTLTSFEIWVKLQLGKGRGIQRTTLNNLCINQGGRIWQPFVGSKNGNENFCKARIYNFQMRRFCA